jgi:hypothetical protein
MPISEETQKWLKSQRQVPEEPSAFEGGLHLQSWLENPDKPETGCSLIDSPLLLLFDPVEND